MKKEQKIYAKVLTALEPGKLVWRTIQTFTDFRTADDWLMNNVRTNHYDMRDFLISQKPDQRNIPLLCVDILRKTFTSRGENGKISKGFEGREKG